MRGQILRTRTAVLSMDPEADRELLALQHLATAQRSRPGAITADLLRAVLRNESIHSEVVRLHPDETYVLSQLAEEISHSLRKLSPEASEAVRAEALRRPARWATALRLCLNAPGSAKQAAIELLAEVGGEEDVALLRTMSMREKAIRPHAAALTRRLAPRVEIADLGTVELWIDGALVTRRLRRKVLGLLCYVSSRPGMASTRDEALEALWPDLTPSTAVNSLHQTIYFLRRLLEPDYKEGVGAGYLQFDGEVLSFDPALVRSASGRCWELIASWQGGIRGALDDLLHHYRGKFALDFSYEDWASAYRDNLHAAVLGVVETVRSPDSWSQAMPMGRHQGLRACCWLIRRRTRSSCCCYRAYKRGGRHRGGSRAVRALRVDGPRGSRR